MLDGRLWRHRSWFVPNKCRHWRPAIAPDSSLDGDSPSHAEPWKLLLRKRRLLFGCRWKISGNENIQRNQATEQQGVLQLPPVEEWEAISRSISQNSNLDSRNFPSERVYREEYQAQSTQVQVPQLTRGVPCACVGQVIQKQQQGRVCESIRACRFYSLTPGFLLNRVGIQAGFRTGRARHV